MSLSLRIVWTGLLLLTLSGEFVSGALTVRVDPAGGAPRLTVNGQPVRSRIFWGAPGSAPLPVTPQWREVDFTFTASGDAANGTMHFRFGPTPGTIELGDIQVTDLDGTGDLIPRCDFAGGMESFRRDWAFWPEGAANTVGRVEVAPGADADGSSTLRVTLTAPATGTWPDFHIYHQPRLTIKQGHHYQVKFRARATPARSIDIAFYRPGDSYVRLGGPPDCFEQQIKLAATGGVNLISFPVAMPWPEPGKAADWAATDAVCETVLRVNPGALLLPRPGMDAPPWWLQTHPEDTMAWEDGHRTYAVVASPRYRHDAAERLTALIEHMEQKYGEHIAGYHPCGQNTGEWFYQDTWNQPLNGYSPADLAAWRAWLKARYGRDEELRRAWHDDRAGLETVAVPTPAARHAAPNGVLRDPATERPLIDWAEFQQEAMADCVRELAHAARTASGGRKLVFFFYGYLFEFGTVENGPATSGHYALRRLLDCPDIDVLCSPISYFDRGLGQSAPSMTAAESVALAGKLWLNEDDTQTFLASGMFPGHQERVETLEETNQVLARNVAQAAVRNFGTWWMDLGATGWFNHPGFWALMKRLAVLDDALLKTPTPFRPEIAAVIDERSMLAVAAGGTRVTRPGIYEARAALGRLGAPYGQYLLDDVLAGRVQAKLYVFLNAWTLSPGEREKLLQATAGTVRVWCYAPGMFEGDGVSTESMRQLTGFDLRPVTPALTLATPTTTGQRLELRQALGDKEAVRPLFAAADAQTSETLATYGDGTAAIALRRPAGGASLFVGAPGLNTELLRAAARVAGVHLFTETDCIVYANGPFLVMHGAGEGPVAVNLSRSAPVIDLLSGESVGAGPRLSLNLKCGETRILRLTSD